MPVMLESKVRQVLSEGPKKFIDILSDFHRVYGELSPDELDKVLEDLYNCNVVGKWYTDDGLPMTHPQPKSMWSTEDRPPMRYPQPQDRLISVAYYLK